MQPSYPSYRCRNSLQKTCSNTPNISHLKLERAFSEYLTQIEDCSKASTANLQDNSILFDHTQEIGVITAEIEQADRKANEIMRLYVTGIIDFKTYQNMAKLSSEQRSELKQRLNQLISSSKPLKIHYSSAEIVTNIHDNWQALNNDDRLRFVQKFINKIVVHGNTRKGQHFNHIIIDEIAFNEI